MRNGESERGKKTVDHTQRKEEGRDDTIVPMDDDVLSIPFPIILPNHSLICPPLTYHCFTSSSLLILYPTREPHHQFVLQTHSFPLSRPSPLLSSSHSDKKVSASDRKFDGQQCCDTDKSEVIYEVKCAKRANFDRKDRDNRGKKTVL